MNSDVFSELLSFPTRRSSDLFVAISISVVPFNIFIGRKPTRPSPQRPHKSSSRCPIFELTPSNLRRNTTKHRTPDKPRSEEHTSELQSRGHRVCRRLLEKKNRTAQVTRGKCKRR